ncbi:Spy/CpxP family protein refolding chaperone [Maribacter chungangensis]|uniref:Spy/CpxP family protein refolding chaperone n=1 Tax=Maribacter chungangensis TaxID=1069117 RepID=A0ABW3B2Q7_9FLAO
MNKILVILFLLFTTVSFGQRGNREKIKSLKVAFITDKLELTSKEAQQFWPVYNKFEEEREQLRKKERTEIREKINDVPALSDTEAEKLLTQFVQLKAAEEKLNTAYLNEINKVLSTKKTLLLLSSEEEFKRRLLRQYRQNRGGRH